MSRDYIKMSKKIQKFLIITIVIFITSACAPTASVIMLDAMLSDHHGRVCKIANVLDNKPVCPEHVVLVQDRELYCKRTLADVECYASDPRENPLQSDNSISPLVEDQSEFFDPPALQPQEVANGRNSVYGIDVMHYPPRSVGTGIHPMNHPK